MLSKVLIANRGEIAVRVARTCRSLGIATVAVHSDVDAAALHVERCDEAVRLGGRTPAESYLRVDALLAAARRTGADAVHPGYGFLSEHAGFARAVVAAGLTWIGPDPDTIAAMGDKLEAKRRMATAGVPLLPSVALEDGVDLDAAAAEVGFPLIVKAAAGGGGKGMRVVDEPGRLEAEVEAARREATGAFGDGRVFLERLVARPRHVEVQILGDRHGAVVHLFERECSIQRRHQKVIEESPSPGMHRLAGLREAMGRAAIAAATELGYVNAGTVEFLVDDAALAVGHDPADAFFFLEVNTRLQVEHPVTELVTGLDLVRLQLLVAAGDPLPFGQAALVRTGHAIEARLYAEDPAGGYLPSTGTITAFDLPDLDGVRLDTGVGPDDDISTWYDPLLAKVIAHGPTRTEAAARLARALDRMELQVVPLGSGQRQPSTNRELLVAVLRHERFLAGETTTAFLDEHFPCDADRRFPSSPTDVATAVVAATLGDVARRRAAAGVLRTLPPGWSNTPGEPDTVTYELDGRVVTCRYRYERDRRVVATVVGADAGRPEQACSHGVTVLAVDDGAITLELDGHRQACRLLRAGAHVEVLTGGGRVGLVARPRLPAADVADDPGATLSPMPGAVLSVAVDEGDVVSRGQLLVTVEAMKMEHRVTAPAGGTVAEVRVRPGQQVEADQMLVLVDVD